jgi:hypothetical protein
MIRDRFLVACHCGCSCSDLGQSSAKSARHPKFVYPWIHVSKQLTFANPLQMSACVIDLEFFMTSNQVDLGTSQGTGGITVPSRVRVIETQLNA